MSTAMSPAAKATPRRRPRSRGDHLLLYEISWKRYEHLLRVFEGRHLRLTYDRGALEIMTLSFKHERRKKTLGTLLDCLASLLGRKVIPAGSTTLKKQLKKRGLEPDESYYVQHADAMAEREEYDLATDPPPDVVVEIEVTRTILGRMGVYAALRVPEVWRWELAGLQIYLLNSAGKYDPATASRAFPELPLAEFKAFLQTPPC